MTLISSLITSGYRESNMISGTKVPTAVQVAEALQLLQTIYLSAFSGVIGYRLADWSIQSATAIADPSSFPADLSGGFTVFPNSRLVCALTAATALSLNPYPVDGEIFSAVDAANNFAGFNLTLNGNGRLIEGAASKVLTTNGQRGKWFYDASHGNWVPVLTATTFLPTADIGLPAEFDDYWIIGLAYRLSSRYGRAITDESKTRMQAVAGEMLDRYNQTSMRDPNSQAVPEGVKEG